MKKRISLILSLVLLLSCVSLAPAAGAAGAKTLEFITDPIYDEIYSLSDGVALAYKGDQFMYIDAAGKVVLSYETLSGALTNVAGGDSELAYADLYSFRDGIALARLDDMCIYFDKTGKVITTVDYGEEFSEGYAILTSSTLGEITLISEKGEQVASRNYTEETAGDTESFEYYYGSQVRDGLIVVRRYSDDGMLLDAGYLNTKLDIAIPLKFEDVRPFNNGLAFAKQDGMWGVINTKGELVIEPQFDDFWVIGMGYEYASFFEGLAAVEKDGKWGYIDTTGKTAVPFTLNYSGNNSVDQLGIFKNGLSYIRQDGKFGYIDNTGKTVIPFIYDDANHYTNGVTLVGLGGKYKLVDSTGATVSNTEWSFEGSFVSYDNPDFMGYRQDGKWGLMKVTDAGPETPSAWAAPEVTRATGLGLVPERFTSGYTLPTTRAEFCALAVVLYETITGEEIAGRETFPDTDDVNVLKLASLEVVNGMDGGKFNPGTPLTREQAATIISRLLDALGTDASAAAPDFKDNDSFGDWSYDAIGLVQSLKIMNGRENGTFDPKAVYTRQECILTMLRTYDCVADA